MRISRWCYLAATAALVAVVAAPATASALLTNEWNQKFAGTEVCVVCHTSVYDMTSHGQFVSTGATLEPSPNSGMWPVGQASAGISVDATGTFSLGSGTGAREYIVWDTSGSFFPFRVPVLDWDPAEPTLWGIDGTTGVTFESGTYSCNQCHQLGATKSAVKPPAKGNFAAGGAFNDVTGTANAWAIPDGADKNLEASYIPGSSIQCEKCHGTGVAATADAGGHWGSGVQIVGISTPSNPLAKAASLKLLDSQVCGQCHASFKSGNIAGFTPDATITDYVTLYQMSDVPTAGAFSIGKSKFFPNSVHGVGQSAAKLGGQSNLHHSYYTEWAMSGHSWRGALTSASPNATPYQKAVAKHFSMTTGGASQILCDRCHTGEGYLKRKLDASAPLGNIMSTVPETVANQGQYGTECADCHIAHGAKTATNTAQAVANNVAVGMSVRPPEKANGSYSTQGLNVDNKSICEDCHNWQVEVLSNKGTVNSAPALPSILGKYVSHPMREIYHGRAMLEIPAGTDFMPGAKCEQCHMPATYSDAGSATGLDRYANRDGKRYSHRMFIMMPGDAKAWGLAPWGDSCSPCHAGETQDQLQGKIDEWQSAAAGLAANVTTAINAAVSGSHNTAAGDVDLLKRASANLSLFVQDSSGGVHNPPYEQAGLKMALQLAKSAGGTLTIAAPNYAVYGQPFGVQGTVLNGDGSAAAGVTVSLWSGSTKLESKTTDANGNYAFSEAVTGTTSYTVLWERSSQSVSDLTASKTVKFEKIPSTLSLSRSASSVLAGRTFTLRGELNPDQISPASIRIQYKKPRSTVWVTLRTLTTNGDGAYSTKYSTKTKGTWQFRALYSGAAGWLGSTSSTVKVLVK
jgi:hypothetical protein